jgi:hypothetical protein
MNAGNGTVTGQILFWEYLFRIFVIRVFAVHIKIKYKFRDV